MATFLSQLAERRQERVEDIYLGRRGGRARADRAELLKRASKLRRCASWLHFRHFITEDLIKLQDGRFCQQYRLCGNCASRRGAKLLRRYVERALAVIAQEPELKGYHVVVTAKNQPNLAVMARHVFGNMQRWINSRKEYLRRPHWCARTELADVAGGVLSGEVKRGDGSGMWHVHVHGILLAMSQPDAGQLANEWRRLTGDSFIVHVEPFHYIRDGLPATLENLAGDFIEVFKYAVKLTEMSFADNWTAQCELQRVRMLRAFGCLFNVQVPADLLDDELEQEDLAFVDLFYRYADSGYRLEHFEGFRIDVGNNDYYK
ncbi:MAG TPA: hypothetical protein VNT52_18180 [Acidimicrobiales bacterium]|nr:hypothetical protein [Acidimicrobiales bacterium]